MRIKQALLVSDLSGARRLVNGGSHGLEAFKEAFTTGEKLISSGTRKFVLE
jgi:peptidoglycan L-alanyl-D-glutamate endopeptidase CwlK